MALPTAPLIVTLDLGKMTLAEGRVFNAAAFPNFFYWVDAFAKFLAKHSNWTAEEIDLIEYGELEEVSRQFGEKFKELASPLAQ